MRRVLKMVWVEDDGLADDTGDTARTIVEPEASEWTGLLDHNGEPIYRKRLPFGFHGRRTRR